MRLEFSGNTNKDYCMVDNAIFHLSNGKDVAIDRCTTRYAINESKLSVLWKEIYVIDDEEYLIEELFPMFNNAKMELICESDADEDYTISNIKWTLYDDNVEVSGSGYME